MGLRVLKNNQPVSITLHRPSQKGNLANVVDHIPVKFKGVPTKGKGERKGAVSTEASTWRDFKFGGSRLQGMVGLSASKACTI